MSLGTKLNSVVCWLVLETLSAVREMRPSSIAYCLSELKILTAVTGWDKFLHLLCIFGLLRWDATHFLKQNSPDLSQRFGSLVIELFASAITPFSFFPEA